MVTFLTSSFIEYQPKEEYVPKPLNESYMFGENLRKYWVDQPNFLVFTSDPADAAMTDHMMVELQDAFSLANFSMREMKCFDDRYIADYCKRTGCAEEDAPQAALREAMAWADVFYLAGGHGPTENAFMKRCGLKELLEDRGLFDGLFLGLSAGTVNAAREAYLIPELEGESIDPDFVRFTDGLGLTDIQVLPHLLYEQNVILDGQKLVDEIIAEDSYGREIYMIEDGSYFMIRNGITEFFGKGYIMENGRKRRLSSGIINADNHRIRTQGAHALYDNIRMFDAAVSEYYDWVLKLNAENGAVEFFRISSQMLDYGIIPVNLDSFAELTALFAKNLVVEEEKIPFLEQSDLSVITDEVQQKGSYVRTIHIDTEEGIKAENLRIVPIAGDESNLLVCLTDISLVLDHDWMTDEYSRSGFIARAQTLLKDPQYASGYSVVYTNIQGFKAVNDLLGTVSGDMVIFMQRAVLVRELRPVLIARLESDHFALITETEKLTEEKLDRICYQNYAEGSKQLPIQIRCGIFQITDPGKKVQYMLDRAKLAENSIPADHGISYKFCDDKMSEDYVMQRLLVSEIDEALAKGEFLTYFQPVVDARTGEIVSAEALIRWKHSERGMISPGQFIPVFEKEGLITKLDSFMVDNVLNFNLQRMKQGKRTIPCAVNLSRVDFYDTRILDIIRRKLGEQERVPDLLKLEVTESAYAELESDAISFLDEMKRLGVSLMLDDFGSGMSSLSTFESFEFDVIKLDMGFISKIGKSPKAEFVIQHTIGLAHDVGARIVAEGVENEQQLKFLREVGCDMIQGYYFYKPMSQEEFADLLQ